MSLEVRPHPNVAVELPGASARHARVAATSLVAEGLSKRFGSVLALQALSLEVRPGEVFGFVGANGAGKTTTMRIILGTLAADQGRVLWAGGPITFEDRRRVGYMPEERGLYPKMRVGEQLAYLALLHGLDAATAAASVKAWLTRFGLADRGRDDLQKLSHGNQQHVQLAAALVFGPVLLVLDEPFAGLDPEAVDAMSEVLHERAAAGIPVLFSSHQLEVVARLSDRVGIISRGRLVACGSVDELRSAGPARLWVGAPGVTPGWVSALPGVTLVRQEGDRLLLELGPGAEDQAVPQRRTPARTRTRVPARSAEPARALQGGGEWTSRLTGQQRSGSTSSISWRAGNS